jgi:hypothetical protein
MKAIVAILFLCCISTEVFSQTKTNPHESIRALKEGVLIVRLPTRSAKIAKLEELSAREEEGSAYQKRLQEELVRTREETERQNRALVRSFRDIYRFSDVMFLYDTSASLLKSGDYEGIFLTDSLQVASSLSPGDRYYLIAAIGVTPEAALEDALIIYDDHFNTMSKPFPYYADVSTIELLWLGVRAKGDKLDQAHYSLLVERLNRKFFKFYKKSRQLEVGFDN